MLESMGWFGGYYGRGGTERNAKTNKDSAIMIETLENKGEYFKYIAIVKQY